MTTKALGLPPIIYGTAWKEEATAGLVERAVLAGFRGIDTANQKKHYREDYVGDALLALKAKGISREELFLQSKYTYKEGQDQRLPYDPKADFTTQVKSSFESTLKNLHTDHLDAYLLHGPQSGRGLAEGDWEVWGAMEELKKSGKTRLVGVSNVGLHHLAELWQKAKTRPDIVQNRCFAAHGWDEDVRGFCLAKGIVYEGFSLLTANPQIVSDARVRDIARCLKATPQQVIFSFSQQIGILPLTGTTDPKHMRDDLGAILLKLSDTDIETIGEITA